MARPVISLRLQTRSTLISLIEVIILVLSAFCWGARQYFFFGLRDCCLDGWRAFCSKYRREVFADAQRALGCYSLGQPVFDLHFYGLMHCAVHGSELAGASPVLCACVCSGS